MRRPLLNLVVVGMAAFGIVSYILLGWLSWTLLGKWTPKPLNVGNLSSVLALIACGAIDFASRRKESPPQVAGLAGGRLVNFCVLLVVAAISAAFAIFIARGWFAASASWWVDWSELGAVPFIAAVFVCSAIEYNYHRQIKDSKRGFTVNAPLAERA